MKSRKYSLKRRKRDKNMHQWQSGHVGNTDAGCVSSQGNGDNLRIISGRENISSR